LLTLDRGIAIDLPPKRQFAALRVVASTVWSRVLGILLTALVQPVVITGLILHSLGDLG
jgi:hypothetical protein